MSRTASPGSSEGEAVRKQPGLRKASTARHDGRVNLSMRQLPASCTSLTHDNMHSRHIVIHFCPDGSRLIISIYLIVQQYRGIIKEEASLKPMDLNPNWNFFRPEIKMVVGIITTPFPSDVTS